MGDGEPADRGRVSQAERSMPALATDYFCVDERRSSDLVFQAIQYARLLTYYDAENRAHRPPEQGDQQSPAPWEAFFHDDISFLLAEIGSVDAAYEYRLSQARDADLKKMIADCARRIIGWYGRIRRLAVAAPRDSIEAANRAEDIIRQELL